MNELASSTTNLERKPGRHSTDPVDFDASHLASLLRERKLSCAEVVEAFIARCEALHPRLNALVVTRFDEARREAKERDIALARGNPVGPLHGVPITIKDEFHVAGAPTTLGIPSLKRRGPRSEEGPLVLRLREAGAIVLGKTNVPQLLIYNESDNPVYGRTNNPWQLERSPGGSSGGEAAIVAAHGSALGLGSDLGGSLRVPAHFCGVSSFKPTSGRLTKLGSAMIDVAPAQEALVPQGGPIARSVADLALAMRVLAAPGQERLDPGITPVPWTETELAPRELRVGVFTDDGFFAAQPAIRRVVEEAAQALADAGANVKPWTPPDTPEAMRLFVALMSADGFASFRRATESDPLDRRVRGLFNLAAIPRPLRPLAAGIARLAGQRRLARTIRSGGGCSADAYFALMAERNAFRRRFLAEMDASEVDILLCPPHALPALVHGASEFLFEAGSYSILFNVLGMPAGVVPAGRVRAGEESERPESRDVVERAARRVEVGSTGLPIGVQVAARAWREDLALRAMGILDSHFRATADYPATPPG